MATRRLSKNFILNGIFCSDLEQGVELASPPSNNVNSLVKFN